MSWLIHIEHNHNFTRDTLNIYLAHKDFDGNIHTVEPFEFKVGGVIDANVAVSNDPTFELPKELAYKLLERLAHMLVGEGDMVAKIQRLERDVTWYKSNLEKLITGLSRLGADK